MIEVKLVDKNEFSILGCTLKGKDKEEHAEARSYFYTTQSWYSPETKAFVIVEEKKYSRKLHGYLLSRLDGHTRTISRLYINESGRGKGYANRLVREIEKHYNKIRIKCLEEVKPFWERQGYAISDQCDEGGYYVGYKQAVSLQSQQI